MVIRSGQVEQQVRSGQNLSYSPEYNGTHAVAKLQLGCSSDAALDPRLLRKSRYNRGYSRLQGWIEGGSEGCKKFDRSLTVAIPKVVQFERVSRMDLDLDLARIWIWIWIWLGSGSGSNLDLDLDLDLE